MSARRMIEGRTILPVPLHEEVAAVLTGLVGSLYGESVEEVAAEIIKDFIKARPHLWRKQATGED